MLEVGHHPQGDVGGGADVEGDAVLDQMVQQPWIMDGA